MSECRAESAQEKTRSFEGRVFILTENQLRMILKSICHLMLFRDYHLLQLDEPI